MNTPLTYKPKILNADIIRGYIMRYFVCLISNTKVVEVDKVQYEQFKKNAFYTTLELKWIIVGNDENITSSDGQTIYGTKHKNTQLIQYYNEKMPGLTRILRNPLEYFYGKKINNT